MLRVSTLLDMPELRLTLRVAADRLDQPITRIYGTELPDPGRYLAGGELVLSGLLWHHGPADSEVFVAALAQAGVAALAASETENRRLPPDLVAACRRHQLPLLEVPVDLSFAAITERVVTELADERVNEAGTLLGRHRRLLGVVAEGGGLQALLDACASDLGAPCWVLTAFGQVRAGVGDTLPEDTRTALAREFLRADRLPKVVRRAGTTPVTVLPVTERGVGRLTGWFLAVAGEPREDTAAELANLVGVERSRVVQARRIENRVAGPLLRLIRSGTAGPIELESRLAATGLAGEPRLRVLAAHATGHPAGFAAEVLAELLAGLVPNALVGEDGDEAYAIAPAGAAWPPDTPDQARAALHALEPGLGSARLLLGISSPVPPDGLRGAIEEASHARRLGERRTGRTCVVSGEEIALHQLLLAGVPEVLRRSLRRRLLGPLVDYDAEHHTDLLGTLRVFLDCSGSWTTAAAQLHVHVNTLRYRVHRVEELLAVDLTEFATRVDLYLALNATP